MFSDDRSPVHRHTTDRDTGRVSSSRLQGSGCGHSGVYLYVLGAPGQPRDDHSVRRQLPAAGGQLPVFLLCAAPAPSVEQLDVRQ